MELVVFGLNHKTSSIAEREAWTLPSHQKEPFCQEFVQQPGVQGVVYLATCNRVEIYAAVEAGLTFEKFSPVYTYRRGAAFAHLLRVMCGLDSMVLGETEVFGQVKRAYGRALALHVTGPLLNFAFQKAFALVKKIRTETTLSRYPVSVSSVGLMLLDQIFDDFAKVTAVVAGLGEMGRQIVSGLVKREIGSLTLVSRTLPKAKAFAQSLTKPVAVYPLETLAALFPQTDLLVTASSGLCQEQDLPFNQRPQVLLDLGVPRNLDPAIGERENVFLYNVDDLKTIAEKNLAARQEEAQLAETMIQKQLLTFEQEWSKRVQFVFAGA